jgi:hypothetical protein
VWDLLYSRAGVWVPIAEISAAYGKNVGNHGTGNFITVLRTEYGLDIRCGYGAWLLAGEHVGVAYLDYVADPTLAQGRPNPAGREV